MKKNNLWIIQFFVLFFIAIAGITVFNYVIDPLQFYRSAPERAYYSGESRWQLPGLAKNYKFDGIILGTSMTQNFLPSKVNHAINSKKTIKMSIDGSSTYEQKLIADLAFKSHNNIKNVLWGVDFGSLNQDINYVENAFPRFLYDDNNINNIKYLFNITTTKESVRYILSNTYFRNLISYVFVMKNNPIKDLEYYNFWGEDEVYGRDKVLKMYNEKQSEKNRKDLIRFNTRVIKDNIDHNIIPLIEENPNTEFYFFYPPISILGIKIMYQLYPQNIESIIVGRQYFYERIRRFDNVSIYDFSTDKDIIFNLDNYKDLTHYSHEINQFILDSISLSDKHKVTDKSIKQFLYEFRKQTENYIVE